MTARGSGSSVCTCSGFQFVDDVQVNTKMEAGCLVRSVNRHKTPTTGMTHGHRNSADEIRRRRIVADEGALESSLVLRLSYPMTPDCTRNHTIKTVTTTKTNMAECMPWGQSPHNDGGDTVTVRGNVLVFSSLRMVLVAVKIPTLRSRRKIKVSTAVVP